MSAQPKPIKNCIKELTDDITQLQNRTDEIRKDLDVNIALATSANNKISTLTNHKDNTDRLKQNQIELSTQHNLNISNVKTKFETINRDHSLLASKLDTLAKTLTEDGETLKAKIDSKFVEERSYNESENSKLLLKITNIVNELETKLTTKLENLEKDMHV